MMSTNTSHAFHAEAQPSVHSVSVGRSRHLLFVYSSHSLTGEHFTISGTADQLRELASELDRALTMIDVDAGTEPAAVGR